MAFDNKTEYMIVCYVYITKCHPGLREHEAAKWLTAGTLDTVSWLPADLTIIDMVKQYLQENAL